MTTTTTTTNTITSGISVMSVVIFVIIFTCQYVATYLWFSKIKYQLRMYYYWYTQHYKVCSQILLTGPAIVTNLNN